MATTKKDPMVCPKCACYYEYKGEVCPEEDGQLTIKVALGSMAKAYLEGVIKNLTSIQTSEKGEEEEKAGVAQEETTGDRQLCLFAV